MSAGAFNKVYFNAFDRGQEVYALCGQPDDHSSRSRSLAQEMPIRGICAQLEQFLLCAPRREETALRHVTPMPQLSFAKAPSPARMVTELFSACSVSHMPPAKSVE